MPARWSGLGAADTLGYRLLRNRTEFGPERLGVRLMGGGHREACRRRWAKFGAAGFRSPLTAFLVALSLIGQLFAEPYYQAPHRPIRARTRPRSPPSSRRFSARRPVSARISTIRARQRSVARPAIAATNAHFAASPRRRQRLSRPTPRGCPKGSTTAATRSAPRLISARFPPARLEPI
jgi:hypothetical protein